MYDDHTVDQRPGYWCVVCGRFLEGQISECGNYMTVTHDDIDHYGMEFNDEDTPQ